MDTHKHRLIIFETAMPTGANTASFAAYKDYIGMLKEKSFRADTGIYTMHRRDK